MRSSYIPIQSRIGTAGEYLVCSDLCLMGYSATLASAAEAYDIIVDLGGILKTVQVKTRSSGNPKYSFSLVSASRIIEDGHRIRTFMKTDAVDYVALVALDRKKIRYYKMEELITEEGHRKSITLAPEDFIECEGL